MSEYEVTTHVECPAAALSDVLGRYERVLALLRASGNDIHGWLEGIEWSQDGSGFANSGSQLDVTLAGPDGSPLRVTPYILGYTNQAMPGLRTPWVQLSFVLEYEADLMEVRAGGAWKYRPHVGRSVCLLMLAMGKEFNGSPIYFNDAPSVNEPWKALTDGYGDRWAFDLAFIPQRLMPQFDPVPSTHARFALPLGTGLARIAAWYTVPWSDSGLTHKFSDTLDVVRPEGPKTSATDGAGASDSTR